MVRQLKLTFFGGAHYHISGWRAPTAWSNLSDLDHWLRIVQKCEDAKFDALFIADSAGPFEYFTNVFSRMPRPIRLHPVALASALAMKTNRIGIAATIATTFNQPYEVARQLAAMDLISNGRAGWNIVTGGLADDGLQFGGTFPDTEERYARGEEFVDVVTKLWESVDADAFPRDKVSGIYTAPDKMRTIDFAGKYFKVRGPLSAERSPQGRPVLVQAGQSAPGRALASRTSEVIFTAQSAYEGGHEFYKDIKRRAGEWGRDPNSVLIMPGIVPFLGESRAEAEDKAAALDELLDPAVGIPKLNVWLHGIDLSQFDLDAPFPELPDSATTSRGRNYVDMARRENLTLRQVMMRSAKSNAHLCVTGTAADVADQMEHWFRHEGADGFNLLGATVPDSLDDFIRMVLPELRRRNLFRTEYEGFTLRENLGIPLAPIPQR